MTEVKINHMVTGQHACEYHMMTMIPYLYGLSSKDVDNSSVIIKKKKNKHPTLEYFTKSLILNTVRNRLREVKGPKRDR